MVLTGEDGMSMYADVQAKEEEKPTKKEVSEAGSLVKPPSNGDRLATDWPWPCVCRGLSPFNA